MINHELNECSKLAQIEYKTRDEWVRKVIYYELSKKLKSDHTNKWFMYNPESVQENDTQSSSGFCDTNGTHNLG